ncbi:hypothetical protein BJ875DRAFT_390223 [Amylocarpus encephaloides]|uniref:Major facilitator superfamily (MFS) profile domain-containing protein n=1 Tax=Amylocarpus encephaloides TaxID=45428 RepID=A0A9P8BYI0_9HELO|nr:hypothetical protein BJ875DRAFT_390223 [Amylocarpus encephaloides]
MGAGIYSIGSIIFFEIVPPRKFPHYSALVSIVITCLAVFGLLLVGLINAHTTWRWIFYLNLPTWFISFSLLILLLPSTMPDQKHTNGTLANVKSLPRIDIIGAVLLLGLCIFIVAPLQLAVSGISFGSVVNIVLFVCAGSFSVVFLFWERFVTTKRELPEAAFPWRLFIDRRVMGMIL